MVFLLHSYLQMFDYKLGKVKKNGENDSDLMCVLVQ